MFLLFCCDLKIFPHRCQFVEAARIYWDILTKASIFAIIRIPQIVHLFYIALFEAGCRCEMQCRNLYRKCREQVFLVASLWWNIRRLMGLALLWLAKKLEISSKICPPLTSHRMYPARISDCGTDWVSLQIRRHAWGQNLETWNTQSERQSPPSKSAYPDSS